MRMTPEEEKDPKSLHQLMKRSRLWLLAMVDVDQDKKAPIRSRQDQNKSRRSRKMTIDHSKEVPTRGRGKPKETVGNPWKRKFKAMLNVLRYLNIIHLREAVRPY